MKNTKSLTLTNEEYRAIDAVANSDLLSIEKSPANYIWTKNAPQDPAKVAAFDFGTALHVALLEPELFAKEVIIFDGAKSRETKKYSDFAAENKGIILLESEYDKLRFTVDGAMYHPTVKRLLTAKSDKEGSIFAYDEDYSVARKIRPDIDYVPHGNPLLADVKTTASIADWRDTAKWKNPLFTHGYGHTAAYYMDTASLYYGQQINEYTFIVLQKSVEMGRYPVAAITITRDECESLGFFQQVGHNLSKYAECKHTNLWDEVERFDESIFGLDSVSLGFEE